MIENFLQYEQGWLLNKNNAKREKEYEGAEYVVECHSL